MLTIPGLQVSEQIHEGQRTVVYRGVWKDTPVVLKAAKGASPTFQQFSRWSHEHAMLARIQGEGVPKALALQIHQNRPVLILEDIGAESLKNIRARTELPLATFLDVALKLAQAVAIIHEQG